MVHIPETTRFNPAISTVIVSASSDIAYYESRSGANSVDGVDSPARIPFDAPKAGTVERVCMDSNAMREAIVASRARLEVERQSRAASEVRTACVNKKIADLRARTELIRSSASSPLVALRPGS